MAVSLNPAKQSILGLMRTLHIIALDFDYQCVTFGSHFFTLTIQSWTGLVGLVTKERQSKS